MKRIALAAMFAAVALFGVACAVKKDEPNGILAGSMLPDIPEDSTEKNEYTVPPTPVFRIVDAERVENDTEDKYVHVYADYQKIAADDETKLRYEGLTAAFNAYNAEKKKEAETFVEETGSELLSEQPFSSEWSHAVTVQNARADDKVVSFTEMWEAYLGGAHGSHGTKGLTLETATGKKLCLSDVLTDVEGVLKMLDDILLNEYDPECFFEPDTLEETMLQTYADNGDAGFAWVLTDEGIVFFFDPYQLGPYAYGAFSAALSYDTLGEMIVPAYGVYVNAE